MRVPGKWAETSPRDAPRPKCAQLFKIKRDENSTARLFYRKGGLPLAAEKEDMFCKKKNIVAVRPVSILMIPVAYLPGARLVVKATEMPFITQAAHA
jgi:hypothetical protein